MIKEFVPYKQALALRDLGFNEHCLRFWNCSYDRNDNTKKLSLFKNEHLSSVRAPLYQQAFRWFREKYKLHISFTIGHDENKIWYDWLILPIETGYSYDCIADSEEGTDYQNAELECLKKLIEIVKTHNDSNS